MFLFFLLPLPHVRKCTRVREYTASLPSDIDSGPPDKTIDVVPLVRGRGGQNLYAFHLYIATRKILPNHRISLALQLSTYLGCFNDYPITIVELVCGGGWNMQVTRIY